MLSPALCDTTIVATHWGSRVRDERERRGWTRVYLAERIGATEGTIRQLEEKPAPPVRSKYAKTINVLFEFGDDVVMAADPRLSQASKLQLAERLAELLADETAEQPIHDQSNVRAFEWTDVPLNKTQTDDFDSRRAPDRAEGDDEDEAAPPSPA